ncbi:MAG: VTC domain-containing protein, partial [Saprospiraceae bacterium]|nr:VTC domain-containing protein [Saprospiraceae bacterium]
HHPASFRPLHPERQINNVYFDTCDLAAYQQNLMGVADRRKIRLRWYGEGATRMNAAQLEIKSRSNETGSKEVILLGDV